MPGPLVEPIRRARQAIGDLLSVLRLVWQAGWLCATLMIVLSWVQALMPAASLWIGKLLIDEVAQAVGGEVPREDAYLRLTMLLALQVGVMVGGTLVGAIETVSQELLSERVSHLASLSILKKAASLDVVHFENAEMYDAMRNAREGSSRQLDTLLTGISLAKALITLSAVGTLMTRLGPRVLAYIILSAIPGMLVSNWLATRAHELLRERATDERRQMYFGSLLTSDVSAKEVRFFGFEQHLLDGWKALYLVFHDKTVRHLRVRTLLGLGTSLVSTVLIGFASLSVLRRAADRTISVGDVSLFIMGIGQLQGQFSTMLNSVTRLYQTLLHARDFFAFLELPSGNTDSGREWHGPIERIEFEHVSFRYPFSDRDALSDVSFRIERGQILALVGHNGAGKSTLILLLTRLFDPTSGRILLNGMDAVEFSPRSVRREMTTIFQDHGRYQMTARDNIALGDVDARRDDVAVEEAGRTSGASDVVGALPDRYDTMLGRLFPGGQQLSGGQWQRLALARLYFRKASVQVFDEPTAALDTPSADATLERLRARGADRITVLISHRYSTVRFADLILVLHKGALIESGTHEQLVEIGGDYASTFNGQATGYGPVVWPAFRPPRGAPWRKRPDNRAAPGWQR